MPLLIWVFSPHLEYHGAMGKENTEIPLGLQSLLWGEYLNLRDEAQMLRINQRDVQRVGSGGMLWGQKTTSCPLCLLQT